MPDPVLLWNTVRHLRPVQVGGRVWHRLYKPSPDLRDAPARRNPGGSWTLPARRRQSQMGAERFRFLNRKGDLGGGWDNPAHEKLWRYNLHYFDDLNADSAADRVGWHESLIHRWIEQNPPARGTGWEPYPVSVRIVNWIKWAGAGGTLSGAALRSLAVQARWLARRLEYHLLGNHLFANAKALAFAGCFFEGPEADAWLAKASAILRKQIPEQILADGGHFELSTMYHALALEDVLDLVNLSRAFPDAGGDSWRGVVSSLLERVPSMRRWLAAMCHPDGEIAFFNDAAFGIAPMPAELDGYARRLGFGDVAIPSGIFHLKDSGYIRVAIGPCVLFADCARIGPDYLPGHAHADTLSFEMSLFGNRILVNSGTSIYGAGSERLRQRGTAAHNTVVVDGRDSSEIWGGFRVARRAYPSGLDVRTEKDRVIITCAHNGYTRRHPPAVHRRSWTLSANDLTVMDDIGVAGAPAEAWFHFHPDVRLRPESDRRAGAATGPQGLIAQWRLEQGNGRIANCEWHPEFGTNVPSVALVAGLEGGRSELHLGWTDGR